MRGSSCEPRVHTDHCCSNRVPYTDAYRVPYAFSYRIPYAFAYHVPYAKSYGVPYSCAYACTNIQPHPSSYGDTDACT